MSLLIDREMQFAAAKHDARAKTKLKVAELDFWYSDTQALFDINLDIFQHEVTAFIGPSGCGKSTLLRALNRTNEIIADTRLEGRVELDGLDIYAAHIDPPELRRRFGWVAQKPNPFPKSTYDNIAYGPRIHGLFERKDELDQLIRTCLERVGMWDEVKDRLHEAGTDLSGGQQQRLCIARAIATSPDIILMDEPCSALDPIATAHIEELIDDLRRNYTIVIITHNMQQAARVAQRTAFFHLGRMHEVGDSEQIFVAPRTELCKAYVMGHYG